MTTTLTPENLSLYRFQSTCADITDRLRNMRGAEIAPGRLLEAACFMTLRYGREGLFRESYDGLPNSEDNKVLLKALLDFADHEPDYFVITPNPDGPFRARTRAPRPNDSKPAIDFIDPDLGYVPGNVIVVSNRALRIRDTLTMEQLKFVSGFYRNAEALFRA